MLAFKTFRSNLSGSFQASYKYSISDWMPAQRAAICVSGYHVANKFQHLRNFVPDGGFRVFLVEGRGNSDSSGIGGNKACFAEIKLLREIDIKMKNLQKISKLLKNCSGNTKEILFNRICSSIAYDKNSKKNIKKVAKLLSISPYLLKRSLNVSLARKARKASKTRQS